MFIIINPEARFNKYLDRKKVDGDGPFEVIKVLQNKVGHKIYLVMGFCRANANYRSLDYKTIYKTSDKAKLDFDFIDKNCAWFESGVEVVEENNEMLLPLLHSLEEYL